MSRYIVTITPPTPNGDLHLGHLSGPFLAADVCARMLRQQGHEVLLLSYSDDYQSYLLRKVREVRRGLADIAHTNAAAIVASLRSVGIELSHFLQALENPYFLAEVNRYFALVEDSGGVHRQSAMIPYCTTCEVYGYEGFGRGTCNHCGSPSDASQCEVCAGVPDIGRMGTLHCMLCKAPMQPVPMERLVWQIGRLYPRLRERYRTASHREALAGYLAATLREEDAEWPLTRPGEQAIPLQRHPGQPIHTWFSGLAGYRAALREHLAAEGEAQAVEQWWNPYTTLVQFLGFDCTYSHAVAYAAQIELETEAPRLIYHFTNRFLKLDGEDFSTSRNHAIWIRDISAEYPVDAVRLYTALHAPENAVDNFSRQHFQDWVAHDYLPRLAESDWRRGSGEPAAAPSAATGELCAPVIAAWRQACDLGSYSITAMARAVIRLREVIDATPPGEREHLWLLYSHLGAAIHPDLSASIRNAVASRCGAADRWLASVLNNAGDDVPLLSASAAH